jgi:Fur family ferric uptake transcriptional regulator
MVKARRPARGRNTWQRGAILAVMEGARCHVTAEEVHRRLRGGARSIGLATVYRALNGFMRDGVVEPMHVGDGKVRYGLTARHHDHLVCLSCGRWEPLAKCHVRVPKRVPSGFTVTGHQLELYGHCARCRGAAQTRSHAVRPRHPVPGRGSTR